MNARPALMFNNGEAFVDGAMYGTDKYEQNIGRDKDFLVPVMIPAETTLEDVMVSLNAGKKRLLKSNKVDIEIDGVKVEHQLLSKR